MHDPAIDGRAAAEYPCYFPVDMPFLHDLGAELLGMGNGAAEVALQLDKRHLNSWHAAHGGIIMTLLDVAMSIAGRSLDAEVRSGVTVDMSVSFLQPAGKTGDRILAKGRAIHRSTTLVFCEGELWNGEVMTARAIGTFKYLRRLPPAHDQVQGRHS
ncbi:MAG: PaaI family thioesterase [Pseudomonadota bacterium]